MELLAPAYAYPLSAPHVWRALEAASDVVGSAVINPASGPGRIRDPAWTDAVMRLWDCGISPLGYLDVAYSAKPPADVAAEAEVWQELYGVDDLFLDQMVSQNAPRAAAIASALAGHGLRVANTGTITDSTVGRYFDVVVCAEGPARPAWPTAGASGAGGSVAAWIVYACPEDMATGLVRSAREAGIGALWVTDLDGSNPYRGLPSYWETLVDAIRACNE